MRSRVARRNRLGSSPRTLTSPAVGSRAPVIIRIVVVLPAPEGPTMPRIAPAGTSMSMSKTPAPSPKSRVAPRRTTSDRGDAAGFGADEATTGGCGGTPAGAGDGSLRGGLGGGPGDG